MATAATVSRKELLRGALEVLLLIVAATLVSAVSFNSAPWVAVLFGLLLIAVALRIHRRAGTSMVATIYALYGAVLLMLGSIVSLNLLVG